MEVGAVDEVEELGDGAVEAVGDAGEGDGGVGVEVEEEVEGGGGRVLGFVRLRGERRRGRRGRWGGGLGGAFVGGQARTVGFADWVGLAPHPRLRRDLSRSFVMGRGWDDDAGAVLRCGLHAAPLVGLKVVEGRGWARVVLGGAGCCAQWWVVGRSVVTKHW